MKPEAQPQPEGHQPGPTPEIKPELGIPEGVQASVSPSAQASLRAKVNRFEKKAKDDLARLNENGIPPLSAEQRTRLIVELITRHRR